MSLSIRLAHQSDLESIIAIYNQAIRQKGLTADLDEQNIANKQSWFDAHQSAPYPIFVATEHEKIVGWVSLSPYRAGRKALAQTAEISLYIHEEHRAKGIGSKMIAYTLSAAKEMHLTTIIAFLIGSNSHSIALFDKFYFERWGILPSIVLVDNKRLDHIIYGLHLVK